MSETISALREFAFALTRLELPETATDAQIKRADFEVNRVSVAVGTLSAMLRAQAEQDPETAKRRRKREAALWILSNLAASTTAARARAATAERLAILDELAPE